MAGSSPHTPRAVLHLELSLPHLNRSPNRKTDLLGMDVGGHYLLCKRFHSLGSKIEAALEHAVFWFKRFKCTDAPGLGHAFLSTSALGGAGGRVRLRTPCPLPGLVTRPDGYLQPLSACTSTQGENCFRNAGRCSDGAKSGLFSKAVLHSAKPDHDHPAEAGQKGSCKIT